MKTQIAISLLSRVLQKVALLLVIVGASQGRAEGILGSKHDLSAASPSTIRANTESEVCIFCHTPHRALNEAPLWNHELSQATYTPYSSSTMKAAVGQPTGSSKLCLSCHDGTVALGMVHSRSSPIEMRDGVTVLPSGASRLGTDLSDDHPVSMKYDASLAALNGQLKDPATLNQEVRLDHEGMMQCTSCHDAHNDRYPKFLVKDDRGGQLCVSCHSVNSWDASAHATSTKTWNGSGPNPWPHTTYNTVKDNACSSCHAPHSAGTKPRLLNFAVVEENCNSCHSGTVAAKNITAEFNKISVHPITQSSSAHDPMEDAVNSTRHVVCADCHNPHAAKTAPATAPNASGALAGVKGMNSSGAVVDPVVREYELCYRCHADSIARGPARVNRQFVQTNTRLEFAPSNPSYHPVQAPGKNSSTPSLIAPWTVASVMYCTDCHNNDQGPGIPGGTGPNGPHGSIYTPLLERNLLLTDNSPESSANYALCYKCHSRSLVTSEDETSWKYHKKHVVDNQTACTTCHDPHGVVENTHLINFNTSYVTPNGAAPISFNDGTVGNRSCTLTCHSKAHDNTMKY